MNSNTVLLNNITQTDSIIPCNETESIKAINSESQEHVNTPALNHLVLSSVITVSEGSETESMSGFSTRR